jgi:aspartate-semialdehyde dehydrogenase
MRMMSPSSAPKIGIVGATGAVGEEILKVLGTRQVPCSELCLFASEKSQGKMIKTDFYGTLEMEAFSFDRASNMDILLLAVGGDFSLEWAEKLSEKGVIVIDNSSAFRMKDDVPLIIPEINMKSGKGKKLIANPNCTTAIALMALWPIHEKYKIKRAIISTYQAASGAGTPGMLELLDGIKSVASGNEVKNQYFAHPLANNIIPHIDSFQDNSYTKEEMKIAWESKKIMNAPEMKVSCTCVRIPTMRAHAESITIETQEVINGNDVRDLLSNVDGVKLVDDPSNNSYPMPMSATGKYDIEVGRIRENDVFGAYGLDLFLCGDQLLRGAALNAVLIAEQVWK